MFLEQDLEFLEGPVSQDQHLFPGLEIQDQSWMNNNYAASELGVFQLPENKNKSYAFTAKFLSQHKTAARIYLCFSHTSASSFSFSQARFQSSCNNVITLLNENLDSFSNIVPLASSVTAFILMER